MDYITYPFQITKSGNTKITNFENYISQLIEQILFTEPGERVNRPAFGCGCKSIIFSPQNQELIDVVRDNVKRSLETYLSDIIAVDKVSINIEVNAFILDITYTIKELQLKKLFSLQRELV